MQRPPRPRPARLVTAIALASFATGPVASRADQAATGSEFQRLVAGFGKINTIAGRGFADSCNGWLANMEAGSATLAELSRPHIAQADAAGNVYIADKEAHAIRMVKPDGTIHTVAGTGARGDGGDGVATTIALREPNGLFTFADGTCYLVEIDDDCDLAPVSGPGKVRRLGTDGMLTTIFADAGLVIGRGLWVSADEALIYYCAGTSVKRWTRSGGIEVFASGFSELGNLDIDPLSGLVCVTDRGTNLVSRLSADGSTRTVIAGTGGTGGGSPGQPATASALDQVRGIAFRPDGSFFVCTHKGDHAVWFVDTAGIIWKFIDGANNAHSGDGSAVATFPQDVISEPRAITIAPNGDLLITEKDEGHVRRITNTCVAPEILAVLPVPGGLDITWRSQREASYRVEASADLRSWDTAATPRTSNGPSTRLRLAIGGQRTFVRVVEQ